VDPAWVGGDQPNMMPRWRAADLDLEVVCDRYLGAANQLDAFQELLVEAAPHWCEQLRIFRSAREQIPVEVAQPDALRAAVVELAARRGPTYRALVERYGPGDERVFGSAELRGAGSELVVVVSVDERVVAPLGRATDLGNTVGLQLRRARIAGRDRAAWTLEVFEALCDRMSPVWGWAGHPGEYWAKVMSEQPSIRPVGRDLGRYLPGVFWLNFFGRPYRQLIGDDQLRSTPADHVAVVDHGVLVGLGLEPRGWDTVEYASAEQRVRDHLGTELFFSKAEPHRPTVAPRWAN
jgi:hypothetical protein